MRDPGPTHSCAGRSLLEILWEELDLVMDALMAEGEPESGSELALPSRKELERVEKEFAAWGELRGQAQSLAYAIAVITSPYDVSIPAIKSEAVERWEERNG